jgi:hypothetical protein
MLLLSELQSRHRSFFPFPYNSQDTSTALYHSMQPAVNRGQHFSSCFLIGPPGPVTFAEAQLYCSDLFQQSTGLHFGRHKVFGLTTVTGPASYPPFHPKEPLCFLIKRVFQAKHKPCSHDLPSGDSGPAHLAKPSLPLAKPSP